jgi:hypothetical protein
MLKNKDNVKLRELEKFGWKKEKSIISQEVFAYKKSSMRIWFRDRHFSRTDAHFGEEDLDNLYDLIQAGLVEKVVK